METSRILSKLEKAFFKMFIVLHAIALILMISALSVPGWVELDTNDMYDFKGSLYRIESGLDNVVLNGLQFRNLEGDSYYDSADYSCDIRDQFLDNGDKCSDAYKAAATGCTAFAMLSLCCVFFVVYEAIAIACTLLSIGVSLWALMGEAWLWVTFISNYFTGLMQILGFSLHFFGTNQTFTGDCDQLLVDNEPGKVCARAGPIIALVTMLLVVLLGVAQCFIVFKKYRQIYYIPMQYSSHQGHAQVSVAEKNEHEQTEIVRDSFPNQAIQMTEQRDL